MTEREEPNPDFRNWLANIWNSTPLESESGKCSHCGKEDVEVKVWRLRDGSIKKLHYCPDCIAQAESERYNQEIAAELVRAGQERKQRRETCGIPPRFILKDFSNFDRGRSKQVGDAFKLCWQFAEGFPVSERPQGYRSLYIYSENSWGVGKTHLSCAIAHRILDRWAGGTPCPSVKWVSEPQLFSKIEASFNYTAEDKRFLPNKDDIINELIEADLLILDDVGKEKRQDPRFVQRTLFAIINGRYDRDYPMVITANLKPALLKGHLGAGGTDEATYDRMLEMCQGKSVPIDGDSYRRE